MKNPSKVAVITGAKQGIGLGIAKVFAAAGYNLVICDLDLKGCQAAARKIKSKGVKVLAVCCDVSEKKQVDQLFQQVIREFGRLDVLVNNAGIFPYSSFSNLKEGDWDKVIDVNLKSVFLCSQVAASKMKSGGKIINISSIAALIGFPGLAHYCASKGGVDSLTRAMALELASKQINVNAIAPGAIDTPGATKGMSKKERQELLEKIPLKRIGKPEDIANVTLFLASKNADYLTGQVLVVDGGWTTK